MEILILIAEKAFGGLSGNALSFQFIGDVLLTRRLSLNINQLRKFFSRPIKPPTNQFWKGLSQRANRAMSDASN